MAAIIRCETTCLVRPHVVLTTAYGAKKQEKSHVIVALTDKNGVVGYGEATPLSNFTGETARVVQLILEEVLFPVILGCDSRDIAAAHQRMDQAIAENHAAKSAVDCAMYDLMAKELGTPLYALLGGKSRERVPINRHLGIMTVEKAVEMAKGYVAQGYRSLKMKIGRDVPAAAERIRSVRAAVGPQVRLRIDANGGLTYVQARQLIDLVRNCDLEYFEQLLPGWDLEGMEQLRRICGVPILVDEGVNSVQDAMRYACSGAADAFTIKLCKCGGLYPAMLLAGAAAAAGIQVVVASTYDTHIGCSACLHLASALPNVAAACDLTTFATQPDQAETAHRLEQMYMQAGGAPGIGVTSMADFPMVQK